MCLPSTFTFSLLIVSVLFESDLVVLGFWGFVSFVSLDFVLSMIFNWKSHDSCAVLCKPIQISQALKLR